MWCRRWSTEVLVSIHSLPWLVAPGPRTTRIVDAAKTAPRVRISVWKYGLQVGHGVKGRTGGQQADRCVCLILHVGM